MSGVPSLVWRLIIKSLLQSIPMTVCFLGHEVTARQALREENGYVHSLQHGLGECIYQRPQTVVLIIKILVDADI